MQNNKKQNYSWIIVSSSVSQEWLMQNFSETNYSSSIIQQVELLEAVESNAFSTL